MNFHWFKKREVLIARIAIVSIFLALIRCLSEVFRLNSLLANHLTFNQIQVFLIGALVAAVSAFILVILYFLRKYLLIALIAVLTIAALIIIKYLYLIPVVQ